MKQEIFYLHSVLPPVELKPKLDREVRVQNSLHETECKTVLKWKDENRFTVYMMNYGGDSGAYRSVRAEHRRLSLSAWSGESKYVGYSPVFCGRIAPDGAGSVIFGQFRQLWWGWLICILVFGGGFVTCAAAGQYLVYLICLALGIPMIQSCLIPERTKSAGELWDTLEYLLETIDGLAAEQVELRENDQN